MEYLKKLLKKDNFDHFTEMKDFFGEFSKKLEKRNEEKFKYFQNEIGVYYKNREQFTKELNEKLYDIEIDLKKELAINSFADEHSIKKIFLFANVYTDFFIGIFLKEDSARKMIKKNPLKNITNELGEKLYNDYVRTNPILLMSVGRFSEDDDWNATNKELLKELYIDDFELREIDLVIVNHDIFKETAKKIIKKKGFNTHDKILGVHIITTLPDDYLLENKAPILRTVSKILHYHKEIEIFNKSFLYIIKNYSKIFPNMISEILKSHVYNEDNLLFNTNDVLEGLANRYVDKQIKEIALEYPKLKLWSEVHNITHIVDDEIVSLSLWRLTSWHLNDSTEHTIMMYRDDILAEMLIEYFSEKEVLNGVLFSLVDKDNNVFSSIKRRNYFDEISEYKTLNCKESILLHHNDADGLSAGFIVEKTLQELDIKVSRYSLEIMFPKALNTILSQYPAHIPLFIVDLGTEIAHYLIKLGEKREIYFIDHHKYTPIENLPDNFHILNPRKYNLNADYEGSSSINAYLFSLSLLDSYKYAPIGLMGAIGDGMYKRNNNNFIGIDIYPFAAIKTTDLYRNNNLYFSNDFDHIELVQFVKEELDLLGSVGYHSNGVSLAFDLMDKKIRFEDPRIKALKNTKKLKYQRAIEQLMRDGFEEGKYYYSFNIDKLFHPMGLKEIGNFLEYLKKHINELPFDLDKDKYLFGSQRVMSLKSIGDLVETPSLKVSMRVGDNLIEKIKNKEFPDLFDIANSFDNIPGGIHALSAAVIIEVEDYLPMLKNIDRFVSNYKNKKILKDNID